ncbi:NAD(P)H-hydrate epimerase [Stieleria varia]|uniref:NAD(P)H-hydrate epimerase n=1 Tax=Stieleria varia TaxID=2528005 RepID=A0A5C6A1I3_9BACT|nr:NAD(P)H-hydrate epimerase [Stieleria varia]TWT93187.1 Bifunctional NAD(P)H-hydrate repair enzyme Nnr [Stieleria varia]
MPPSLSREQVRSVDRIAIQEFGIRGVVLMENAGRGAAEVIHRLYPGNRIVLLCGKGNNAGDGYVIARHLDRLGHDVRLVSVVALDELTGDAAENAGIARKAELEIVIASDGESISHAIDDAEVLVDCLLGTGATGAPREPFASAVRLANGSSAVRIAIDVPTGLDCDSGKASEVTFRAEHTITFVARKLGMDYPAAGDLTGEIHVVEIGVPTRLLRSFGLG